MILTPLTVAWNWPVAISIALLFVTLVLLLFAGQTVIFLLRLVASDRREGRRVPIAGGTPTVGQLEDVEAGPARRRRDRTAAARSGRARIAVPPDPRSQETARQVPVLATFFSVRRGRDPFFKFFMKTIFPRQVREYEEKFGIKFVGWYNVAHGWDFDNVILLDLPDYSTLDKLEADEATRALGHRAGEWIFERHHSMFLRERLGPDLEYHG